MPVVTPTILNENRAISPEIELISVDVTREINRVPRARLELLDGDAAKRVFPVSNMRDFEPGRTIEIRLRYEGSSDTTVFKGVVVSHAVQARHDSPSLIVELTDAAVSMTRIRRSAVHRDLTDAEVMTKLIRDAGLESAGIQSTQPKHAALIQYDCTDWDFLLSRADVQELVVSVDDGKVSIQKLKTSGTAKERLEWGLDDILDFDIKVDGSHQINSLETATWDSKTQALAEPSMAADTSLSQGNLAGAAVAKAPGFQDARLVNSAALSPEERQAWADSRLARSRWSMIRGRVAIPGSARFHPLDTIEISGISKRFDGRTVVTGVRHRLDHQGWQTDVQFGISPERFCDQPHIPDVPAAGLLPAVNGLQIGVVDRFEDDPDKELRVRVIIPTIDENEGSLWARLVSPDAGKDRGFCFRPEPGDEVVLGFLNDDPRQPIILGAMFSSKNAPPEDYATPEEQNQKKGLVTRQGTTIGFVDAEKASVFIETGNRNKLLFDDDSESIQLSDQHGNTITMDRNGISLKSAKDLNIEASGNVEIKGAKVDVK